LLKLCMGVLYHILYIKGVYKRGYIINCTLWYFIIYTIVYMTFHIYVIILSGFLYVCYIFLHIIFIIWFIYY